MGGLLVLTGPSWNEALGTLERIHIFAADISVPISLCVQQTAPSSSTQCHSSMSFPHIRSEASLLSTTAQKRTCQMI